MEEKYLNENYEFKYNEILTRVFFRKKGEHSKFKLLKGYEFNSLYRELKNNDIKLAVGNFKSLLESDFVPKFNPFKDYFRNLPEWNGEVDYIGRLAETVETTDNELFRWAFKKWIVALVACALKPDIANHSVLIFTGAQGIGKTTWLMRLLPEKLKEYGYSGSINPGNKDSNLLLSEKLLINMDELSSYNKSKIEAFKDLITKEVISERRAYGYFSENYVRNATFCGTANHNEVLMDVTGNRRFLVFEAVSFQRDHGVNLDNVYSQAYSLMKSGFQYYFDLDEIKRIETNNEQYKQSNAEEEYLDKFFKTPEGNTAEECIRYMNATEVIQFIRNNTSGYININSSSMGKLLKSKGFESTKKDGLKKYIVVVK